MLFLLNPIQKFMVEFQPENGQGRDGFATLRDPYK